MWKQACGDPQNGVQDIGDGLIIQDCTTDEFSGTNKGLLDILSRAYPRSAPGRVTELSAHGADFTLTGATAAAGCGLEVWIPGANEPAPSTDGVTDLTVTAVEGGWLVKGCVDGEYSVTNGS